MDENAKRLMASLQQDPAKIQALLRSGDGQTLLRMLTERDQGAALQHAAQSAAQGQTEELQRMLSQVMGSPHPAHPEGSAEVGVTGRQRHERVR